MLLLSVVALRGPAQASPLNLTLQPAPDIFSDGIEVNYDAGSQVLSASGFAEHIKNGAELPTPIVNGQFEITAVVSNSGAFQSGTITITGEVPSLGMGPGVLLTGNLSAFGYGEAGAALECQFSSTGGTLSSQFGPTINVILGQSGFPGSFARNFNNGLMGVAGIGW